MWRESIRSLWRPSGAIAYALLARSWQVVAAIISLLLIAHFFSPNTQGFYYTFASLLALQVFAELGLNVVIINTASHEWSKLRLNAYGRIEGDEGSKLRLISLGHFTLKWYSAAAVAFVLGCGGAGYWFLSTSTASEVTWRLPWLAAVVLAGGMFCATPFLALLEGCNQVKAVNRFRLWQAIVGSLALWATVVAGGNLWATSVMGLVVLTSTLYFLLNRYGAFFRPFRRRRVSQAINWKHEIWPMQWRIGIQGLVNYFIFSFFTPVIFYYHGAQSAGRVGMTLQAINGLQALALAWIQVHIPRFGDLIAREQFDQLNTEWRRATLTSTLFIIGGAVLFFLLIYFLNSANLPFAERLLGPFATSLFLAGLLFAHINQCQAVYLRAHKREVLMLPVVISGIGMGLAVWWLGRRYGMSGVAMAYFLIMTFVAFPMVNRAWSQARKEWHGTDIVNGDIA